jgi:hypothetical protein
MIALFYIVLVIGLVYSFKVSTWARFTRMGHPIFTPPRFMTYPKVYYLIRWFLIIGLIILSVVEQLDWPIWLFSLLLFVISVWIARQYAAIQLSRNFRKMYRDGELVDPETGKPMTPLEALEDAMEYEKMSVRGWR